MKLGFMAILTTLLGAGSSPGAAAADISLHANNSSTLNAIAIAGEIVEGDTYRLKAFLSKLPPKKFTAVYLRSAGGNYLEGLEMGRFFHRAGIRTVTEGQSAECYSACAFAFLGGYDFYARKPWRTKASTSKLGFHSYFMTLDKPTYSAPEVDSLLLASQYSALLLVDYFQEVQADARVLSAALSKKSSELFIITNSDALEFGINIWDEEKDEMVWSERVSRLVRQ